MGKNKIKNIIKNFFMEIKRTRKRTKVLYLGILVFAGMIFSIRYGEITAPVEVIYHVTGGINGIDETYRVYKEGLNYYVELSVGRSANKPGKYKISRNEFYRCVNKKLFRDEKVYSELRKRNVVATDEIHSTIQVRYAWGEWEELKENPYAEEIKRLYTYKSYLENREEIVDDLDKLKFENSRLLNVWSDACYKYRVKNSEMAIVKLNDRGELIILPNSFYIGEKSSRTVKELLIGQLEYDEKLIHYKDIIGEKDYYRFLYMGYKYLNEKDEDTDKNKVVKHRLLSFLNQVDKLYKSHTLNSYKYAIQSTSEYRRPKKDIFKSIKHGNEMINFYYDASEERGYVVYYRTNDFITRDLLANELKAAVKYDSKKEVFGNPYVAVRVLIFAVIEMGIFMRVGKRKKREINM